MKPNVKETSNPKYGDYQFDASTQISRQLSSDKKVTPQQVAKAIIEHLEKIPFVEKVISMIFCINLNFY